jgi:7,8-dihydroneopterin aldolase/epimerase/oxygenase
MDETAIAFELPHVRAAATAGQPLTDRISVRDYTRDVEIGAFSSERGRSQRIRFNVVLEVCHSTAAEDDDVDKVVSYDTITDAIEVEIARERINLLETLAERVARRCLADRRAVRAFVRVEKLDRIPGALGVEIVRTRTDTLPQLRPKALAEEGSLPAPIVLFLSNAVLRGPQERAWLDAATALARPMIVAVEPLEPQPEADNLPLLRIGLLSAEQNAWGLAARDPRFTIASSRTEIDWALRARRPAVWAPTKLVADSVERLAADASAPAALAAWLAAEIGAECVLAVGAADPFPADVPVRHLDAASPGGLAELV